MPMPTLVGARSVRPVPLVRTMKGHRVEVAPWVVLHAVRYSLGRLSIAHGDGHDLIRAYWPVLREWRDSIVADLIHAQRWTAEVGGHADLSRQCAETLAWIEEQQ